MAAGSSRGKGFTLLELLVAMTLMVATSACLYTALYTGFRAHRSALSAVEPTSAAVNAIELIKQDIYGVLRPGGALSGAFTGRSLTGIKGVDADSLEFYTTHIYASNGSVVGGLAKIELGLEEDTDAKLERASYLLTRRVTANLLTPRVVEAEEHILCRAVMSLNLRYFDGEGWVDEWDSAEDANSLPLAVEVEIRVANTTRNGLERGEDRLLMQSFAIPCGGAGEEESQGTGSGAGGS